MQKQPDNEIWLVDRIYHEDYFSSKVMEKINQEDWFQTTVLIYFGRSQLGNTIKTNSQHFRQFRDILKLIFIKGSGTSFLYFMDDFLIKIFLMLYSIN